MTHTIVKMIRSYDGHDDAIGYDHVKYLVKIGPSMVSTEDVWWTDDASDALFTESYDTVQQWLNVALKWSDNCYILTKKD